MPTFKLVVMAGGTGGHIYPALASAEEIRASGGEVFWLGSRGGMEERLVPEWDIPLYTLSIKGVRGKGLVGKLAAPFRILHAIGQAVAVLQKLKPDAVLGMGGFVAGPGGVAARLLGIPLIIHEQNAVAGTTNKLLAKIAKVRLQAFEGALEGGLTIGNPLRKSMVKMTQRISRVGGLQRPLKVLVVGGSLGAKAINDAIPQLLQRWSAGRLDIWHQTGERNLAQVQQAYQSAGLEARVDAYIADMVQAYYWADVVICRAGAMTVSELAVAGVPAILIPFPFAIDDHQTKNARYLADAGAAVLLPQTDLTPEKLEQILLDLSQGQDTLASMSLAAKQLATPNATLEVAQQCLRFKTDD